MKKPTRARRTVPKRKSRSPAVARSTKAKSASLSAVTRSAKTRGLSAEAHGARGPLRWNASPEDVQRSVMQLVLTLVEFIRKLLERQAIRRMEGHTLTKKETENVGLALMRLEETIQDLAAQFGLEPEDLNLDLGPVGRLM